MGNRSAGATQQHTARRILLRRHRSSPTLSFPRKREPRLVKHFWFPACAGMTLNQTFLNPVHSGLWFRYGPLRLRFYAAEF